jgi:diguanylate cyclase (GGDEF)-like protein/PAS domain S-box-containing protein
MKSSTHPALGEYIDLLLDAICVVDKDGRYVYVSASFETIFGYTPKEVLGRRMIELVHPDDRERTLQTANGIMSGNPQFHFENRYLRKDGQIVNIMWSARWSENHQLRIAVARDITRRKHAETVQEALYAISEAAHATEDLQALYRQIHHIVGELLAVSAFSIALRDDSTGAVNFVYHADKTVPLSGSQKPGSDALCARVIRSGQALLLTPDRDPGLPENLRRLARELAGNYSRSWLGVPLASHKGTIGALVVQNDDHDAHYTDQDQELLQFVSAQIATAIERKQMIASLQHMALYDSLTRLPNRQLFHDRMRLALARARRGQMQLSLVFIDLDRFKEVNDTLGHGAGDQLLQQVARRLEQCVRAGDTVARFGGDEFVVLLENIASPENVEMLIEKFRNTLHQPFDLAGKTANIIASFGVAHCPQHGNDEKQLLRHADEAMYIAKKGRISS